MPSVRDLLHLTTRRDKNREVLCGAIKGRRVIEFYYHGGYRTVEPFCLGVVMAGADNESLICYQTGGYSELLEVVGWKLYRVSEMENIEITRREFGGDRPGYDPDDIGMARIICRVVPVKIAPKIAPKVATPRVDAALTHNELMKRFRFTHPAPLPRMSGIILSRPPARTPPERPESKITPLVPVFDRFLLPAKTG
ncbi:MAG TPA: hypothetical protein VJ377_04525 [Dehalococcoidales bacterium]|nr:MAG: hypothetical protein A2Z05_00630 [Chloroflexi bacterium RBG_16_60_22]HJX12775.1 hypothetical protein [Dehalococcoidales bacterium]